MDLYELLARPCATLPKGRVDDRPFGDFLHSIFDDYLRALDELDGATPLCKGVKDNRTATEALTLSIEKSISQYLDGYPHAAYNELVAGLTRLDNHLSALKVQIAHTGSKESADRLYRIRTGKMAKFTRADLFHVPFQLRHFVRSQRYSIPGLPCLYLSGSLWACWEEMQRPEFHTIQMSRFAYQEPLTVLDLGFRPGYLSRLRNKTLLSEDVLRAYAICWPLIAACSVRVYAPGAPFVPEYIIPQLLLQWIRNEAKLDGVRYFSTRIDREFRQPWAAMNYVFLSKNG